MIFGQSSPPYKGGVAAASADGWFSCINAQRLKLQRRHPAGCRKSILLSQGTARAFKPSRYLNIQQPGKMMKIAVFRPLQRPSFKLPLALANGGEDNK
jgi:hypothetical protein